MIHKLKIQTNYLQHIYEGKKKFEVRLNDRDYQVGDFIIFDEIPSPIDRPADECKTKFKIIYVHHGLGMQDNYVVLGIEAMDKVTD
jgi:ASC-1-like (ASCH) protein